MTKKTDVLLPECFQPLDPTPENIFQVQSRLDKLEHEKEILENQKSELIKLFIAETCTTDKKLEFEIETSTLKLYSRDYKKFSEDIDLELSREKKRHESATAPLDREHKSIEDEIKRKAERENKVSIDRKWYSKIE